MGEDFKDETLFRIKNLGDFRDNVKIQVWKKFQHKIFDYFEEEHEDISSIIHKKEVDETYLCPDIVEYEMDKFIVFDEFNPNKGYIMKSDIRKLIISLTNEVISRHLNSLVDSGTLEMCWDHLRCEFIWRPKIKE